MAYKHVARNLGIATIAEIGASAGFVALASSQAQQPNPDFNLIASELGIAYILGTVSFFTGIGALWALVAKNA